MKRLVLCGAAALSLIGLVLIGSRNDEYGDERDKENRGDEARPYHRRERPGLMGTVLGPVGNVADNAGHFAGHATNNILGNDHRGFRDSNRNYHR